MADIALGMFFLRFLLNEHQPENFRHLYQAEIDKFP